MKDEIIKISYYQTEDLSYQSIIYVDGRSYHYESMEPFSFGDKQNILNYERNTTDKIKIFYETGTFYEVNYKDKKTLQILPARIEYNGNKYVLTEYYGTVKSVITMNYAKSVVKDPISMLNHFYGDEE
jgi:hypothetical protein